MPQSPGVEPKNCIAELERCVEELGFVGCNLNPDPSGGYWKDPPLTDRWWYPLYEKMVELDVPGMVHVTAAANPVFHTTGSALHQRRHHRVHAVPDVGPVQGFPDPAVHHSAWRRRGSLSLGPLSRHRAGPEAAAADRELLLKNVFFDTCVYHQPGIDLLTKVIPAENILFASEMVGAVKGIDPETGFNYDDTRRYIDSSANLTAEQKRAIFADNARRVYPRIPASIFN